MTSRSARPAAARPDDFPADRLVLRSLACRRAQRYYAYVPTRERAPELVLVAVHGISRDAREQALAWQPVARALGCALVAPVFERSITPGYQRLGWDSAGMRADRTLDAIVAEVQADRGGLSPHARLVLAGYSGGAQFCHRYALAYPQRVRALICGAAGWYTWPDSSLPWPYGTGRAQLDADTPIELDGFLQVPTFVYVGTDDVGLGTSLRSTPELDVLQGTTRRERAGRWVAALARACAARGLRSRAVLHPLAGVGHVFAAAAAGGAVAAAAAWLQALPLTHPRGEAALATQGDLDVRT